MTSSRSESQALPEPMLGGDHERRPVTLQSIIDSVGGDILEVLRAPRSLDVVVGELVIHDPMDSRGPSVDDVILAVGVDPNDREAAALTRRAGDAGASAVVFKVVSGDEPVALVEASTEAEVALLTVTPDVVWGQLHALLRTARAAVGDPAEVGSATPAVGDLFALANAVASMVGGATTIEDPRSTVLAYSSTDSAIDEPRRQTILGRRVPEEWLQRLHDEGVFRRLWIDGMVRVELGDTDPENRTRLAVAVRAGGEILGSIWVVEGDRPLDERAELALAEAGRIAALHLLRYQAGDDIERRRRGDLLRSLLAGRPTSVALGPSMGITDSSFMTVVAFELQLGEDGSLADQTAIADRVVSTVTIHCEAFRRRAAVVAEGHVVYVLLPEVTEPAPDRLVSFAESMVEHLRATLKVTARVGIGATTHGLGGLLGSRGEADQALRVLAVASDRSVAHIDDVRSGATLLALRDLAETNPRLRAGKLARLVDDDRKRQGVYVETLRAYLDAFGDVAAAAASVHVHPNTFRYRVRRLLEVSGIDLDDPAERLITHLQLTFLDHDTPESGVDP